VAGVEQELDVDALLDGVGPHGEARAGGHDPSPERGLDGAREVGPERVRRDVLAGGLQGDVDGEGADPGVGGVEGGDELARQGLAGGRRRRGERQRRGRRGGGDGDGLCPAQGEAGQGGGQEAARHRRG
jgi:hypothetical protein